MKTHRICFSPLVGVLHAHKNIQASWVHSLTSSQHLAFPIIFLFSHYGEHTRISQGFPGGSRVKNPLQELQETGVRSLGREDPLEEGMATLSSTPAWRIPRAEEPGRLQSVGSQRVGHDRATQHTCTHNDVTL